MYQQLTKLFLAGVVAVALLATASTAIIAPAWAQGPPAGAATRGQTLGNLECTAGQIARFDGTVWVCSDAMLVQERLNTFIFVTSTTTTGDLGGIEGADATCNALAATAGLPGDYLAWLANSDPDTAPNTRFFQSSGPYLLPNGIKVADDYADLKGGGDHAVDRDEFGDLVSTGGGTVAWTNVLATGAQGGVGPSNNHCDDWINGTGGVGNFGVFTLSSTAWTSAGSATCTEADGRFYCVGQEAF